MDKIVLSGSPEDLQTQISILNALRLMLQEGQGSGGCRFMPREYPESVVFKLRVFLYFSELDEIVKQKKINKPRYSPVDSYVSIRLPINMEAITLKKVQEIAQLALNKFKNFRWQRGKVMCTYTDKNKGIKGMQILAIKPDEGKKVIEQMLDLAGISFDGKCFNFTQNASPTERYDDTPKQRNFIGKMYKEDIQRPVTTLLWRRAEIALPPKNKTIPICDNKGWLIKEISFLDNYLD